MIRDAGRKFQVRTGKAFLWTVPRATHVSDMMLDRIAWFDQGEDRLHSRISLQKGFYVVFDGPDPGPGSLFRSLISDALLPDHTRARGKPCRALGSDRRFRL
jgi:hypothetical protein